MNADNSEHPQYPWQARQGAALILDGFVEYNHQFRKITRRAQLRFERREWALQQPDLVERIELYDTSVAETSQRLLQALGDHASRRDIWEAIKPAFEASIATLLDQELYKTYFNTLTRRFFKTRGVDAAIEFVALDIEPTDRIKHPVARLAYSVSEDLPDLFRRILADTPFAVPYAHAGQCARLAAETVNAQLASWGKRPARSVELLETRFYRERRAYLVGRVFGESEYAPFVIALANRGEGIVIDAVILNRADVTQLFGFTRSYFLADFETVGDAVVFLKTLLPRKAVDEWFAVLGRLKQAKTERFRLFFRHLEKVRALATHVDLTATRCAEQFVHAPGERGMVMAVFHLPSYPLVFKLIRDKFAPVKTMARADVMAKYQLVFKHDRAGRLVDAQEFRHLRFPRQQFEQSLLDELTGGCRESVLEDGDDIVLTHCYVERYLRPLNLFIKEAAPELAMQALLDYAQSIKDLAMSNIFPGDLLLKNFGVTRHGRAIFYDYDELCMVSECRFRALPTPSDNDEEMHHGAWYYVGDNDVFPEQFPRFLGLTPEQERRLIEAHGEIFDVRWWLGLQERLRGGTPPEIAPYSPELSLIPSEAVGTG
ncbi:MAG: bifunctional isocitrate dehydrogenase kinase/phosphatase [Pseudomonadota bacterium]|nr:bifunctional isocitrate dehydrogenase kinase/phosphatase [Pseudomonadota bacterium]